MKNSLSLSLLVIDEDQLLAEKIIAELQLLNVVVHMAILDEKKELVKALRRKWDIVLLGKAYDLNAADVIGQIQSHGLDLPVIAMLNTETIPVSTNDTSDKNTLALLDQGIAQVGFRSEIMLLARKIAAELKHLTKRRKARETRNMLDDADIRTKSLLRNAKSAVAYVNEGMHVFANRTYLNLFGYDDAGDLIGMPVIDLVDGKYASEFKNYLKRFMKGDSSEVDFEFEGKKSGGETFEAKLQLAPASYDGEPCAQIIIQPKNPAALMTGEMASISDRIDSLTGLGNRLAFEEEIKKARAHAIQKHQQHGLMFVSVDNIGQISASMGLEGTDATIIHVGQCIKEQFGEAQISRFSDSGFTVVIYDTDKETMLSGANTLRETIDDALINVDSKTVRTTVSIGMVLISETSPDTNELFDRAFSGIDKIRKQTHGVGNDVYIYDPYANASTSDSALFETVNNALDKNLFKLMYQPIYNVDTDASNFYEVYLRLPLPDGSNMSPDKFLEIAEQSNMLERLDRWVMLNATKALRKELKNDPRARILVNLSKNALQDSGLPEFAGKLNKAIGKPNAIMLQFGEQDVTNYLSIAKQQFQAFSQAGCLLSINNFGSSLKSLDLFDHVKPLMVKLDRSYAKNLQESDNLKATQGFVADIKEHSITPMMAFIEDASTMSAAWSIGAPYLQGVYLQEPQEELTAQPAQAVEA